MKANITTENHAIVNTDASLSILESLEKNGVQVEFQCRDGYCGVCRCKLIAGKVGYLKDTIAFIGEDEVLLCCAKPTTDIIIKL